MNRRKKKRTIKKMLITLIAVSSVYVLGTLSLNSIESALNIEVQRVQEEIDAKKGELDGLNIARQEKISFDNIVSIAKNNGYSLNFTSDQTTAKTE